MKTLCCFKGQTIELEKHLNQAQPIVFALAPFTGETYFRLSIVKETPIKVLCFNQIKGFSFATHPHYANYFKDFSEAFLVLVQSEAAYTSYMCLSHDDLIVRAAAYKENILEIRAASGTSHRANHQRPALLCVRGDDLYQTMYLSARLAMELTGHKGKLAEEKASLPAWLDTLGWDSGIAYGKNISHDKVVNAIWGLRQLGIQPGFVLIDEGWQQVAPIESLENSAPGLISFEADPQKFPYGIKGLVEELHRAGVHHVGVWHGMMGYRGGVHPYLAEKYDLPPDPFNRYFLGYDLGSAFQFYYDFYGFLREQGVSFVKVGDQNSVKDYCRLGIDITAVFQNLQAAIQGAASLRFDIPPFNSECLRNENQFYWVNSVLASACEFPEIHALDSAKMAIRNTLVNALWLQYVMQPDFNAWTTGFAYSSLLAVLHALSGSINVISDLPGKYDKSLLQKMALPSGRILRSDKPLTPCQESVFEDPLEGNRLYKAYTYKGDKGVLAIFNLSRQSEVREVISPSDVGGIVGELYTVFSHHQGFMGLLEKTASMEFCLKENDYDVLIFSPIKQGIALIGCYLFYLPPAAINEITIEEESVHVASLVIAPMAMYCERQVLEVRRNGEIIPWEYDYQKKLLIFDSQADLVELPCLYTIAFE